jgi:hypothetical protein
MLITISSLYRTQFYYVFQFLISTNIALEADNLNTKNHLTALV